MGKILKHRRLYHFLILSLAVLYTISIVFTTKANNGLYNASDVFGHYTGSSITFTDNLKDNGATGPNNIGLYNPNSVAIDTVNNILFVADTGNARVLGFNLAETGQQKYEADYVLGQSSFTSKTASVSQKGLSAPVAVIYDGKNGHNRLFVADDAGLNGTAGRVLVYDFSVDPQGLHSGMDATYLIGQPLYTTMSGSMSQSTVTTITALAYDNVDERLFVADYGNNVPKIPRVLVFDVRPASLVATSMGMNADNVLCTDGFTSATMTKNNCTSGGANISPWTSGNYFYANPVSSLAYNWNNKLLYVNSEPVNSTQSSTGIYAFDVDPATNHPQNGQDPKISPVISSSTLGLDSTYPLSFLYDKSTGYGARLFASSLQGNRIKIFDSINSSTFPYTWKGVIGQKNSTYIETSPTLGEDTLYAPRGMTYDENNERLYVADSLNNRVMIYDFLHLSTGNLPAGTINSYYSASLVSLVQNPRPQGTITYKIVSGKLPSGIDSTVFKNSGVISGTPTEFGTFNFQVRVSNIVGNAGEFYSNTANFSIVINQTATNLYTLSKNTLPDGHVGVPYPLPNTSAIITLENDPNQIDHFQNCTTATKPVCSTSTFMLPNGFTLVPSGSIAIFGGTPQKSGVFTFSLRAVDSAGKFSSVQTYSITITDSLACVDATTYNQPLQKSGDVGDSVIVKATINPGASPITDVSPFAWGGHIYVTNDLNSNDLIIKDANLKIPGGLKIRTPGDGYAYVITDANTLEIYDESLLNGYDVSLSSSSRPKPVGMIILPGDYQNVSLQNLYIKNNLAYISVNDFSGLSQFYVVDMANRKNPLLVRTEGVCVNRTNTAGNFACLGGDPNDNPYLSGTTIYADSNDNVILGASNNPDGAVFMITSSGSVAISPSVNYGTIQGLAVYQSGTSGYAYVSSSTSGNYKLRTLSYDFASALWQGEAIESDPRADDFAGSMALFDDNINGTLDLLRTDGTGLSIFTVTPSATPGSQVSFVSNYNASQVVNNDIDVAMRKGSNYAFLSNGGAGFGSGLNIVDITDRLNPNIVFSSSTAPDYMNSIAFDSALDLAWGASYNDGRPFSFELTTSPTILTLNKIVSGGPAKGGPLKPEEFYFSLNGGVTNTPFSGTGQNVMYVSPDTYTITESKTGPYYPSFSGTGCDATGKVVINDGDRKTCTITNTYSAGGIKIATDGLNYAYMITNKNTLDVYDISDPVNKVNTASIYLGNSPYDVQPTNVFYDSGSKLIYVTSTDDTQELIVLSISGSYGGSPAIPKIVKTLDLVSPTNNTHLNGNDITVGLNSAFNNKLAYMIATLDDGSAGYFYQLSSSNPTATSVGDPQNLSPQLSIGKTPPANNTEIAYGGGDAMYVAGNTPGKELSIYEIDDMVPTFISTVDVPGVGSARSIAVLGKQLLVSMNGTLNIYSISDPYNPVFQKTITVSTTSDIYDIATATINGSKMAYLAVGSDNYKEVNFTNLSNPIIIGQVSDSFGVSVDKISGVAHHPYMNLGATIKIDDVLVFQVPAQVQTDPATNVTSSTAVIHGQLIAGAPATISWNITPSVLVNPTLLTSVNGAQSLNLSGLKANTKYDYQMCATNASGTACGATQTFTTPVFVGLKFYVQGYYVGSGFMKPAMYNRGVSVATVTDVDLFTLELRKYDPTYDIPSDQKNRFYPLVTPTSKCEGMLKTNGTFNCVFPKDPANDAMIQNSLNNGVGYYIVIKNIHSLAGSPSWPLYSTSFYTINNFGNVLETWSATPVAFVAPGILSYDFTTSSNKAFGGVDGQVQVDLGKWAFFTGDMNQDRNIDLIDFPILDSGINNGLFGYHNSDLNGDGNTDLLDFPVLDSSIQGGVFTRKP